MTSNNPKEEDPTCGMLRGKFPYVLRKILDTPEYGDIVRWSSDGKSWKVFLPKRFEEEILPRYFRGSKYASFVRQSHFWNFRRLQSGSYKGYYFNVFFSRDNPELCSKMYRTKYVKKQSKTFTRIPRSPDLNQNMGQITSLSRNLADQHNYSRVADILHRVNMFTLNQSTDPSFGIGSRRLGDMTGLGSSLEFHNSTAANNLISSHIGSGTIPNIFNNQMFAAHGGITSADALSFLDNLQNFVDTGYGINHGNTLMTNSRADCLKLDANLLLQQKALRQQEMSNQNHLKTFDLGFDQQKLTNALLDLSRTQQQMKLTMLTQAYQQLQRAFLMNPTLLSSNGVDNLPSAVDSYIRKLG